MSIKYHVADSSYRIGDDLFCRDELERQGRAPEYKWDDAEAGFDGDVVCLFDELAEARDMQAEFGGIILEVKIPDDDPDWTLREMGFSIRIVAEGYTAVRNRIPAEYIREA